MANMRFLLTMALLGAWRTPAAAGPVRVIYLPLAGIAGEPDAQIDEALSAELAEQPQLFVQLPSPKKSKTEVWHALKSDRSWMLAAQKAVDAAAYDAAIAKLKKGIGAAWKKPDANDTGVIADAQLLLSVAQFRRGNEDEGTKALTEYVRLRPDEPLSGDYPPLFVRLHAQARKRWQQKATTVLHVDVDADVDGVILVNGRQVGKAPLVLEHLPPGAQLIAFSAGDKQIVRRVDSGGALESVRFAVAGPRRNPLVRNAFVRWSKAELAELARSEGAAFAVSGAMISNGAGAGHTLAVVVVSSSGEGAVAAVVTLADAQNNWGVEMNRLGARVALLVTSGVKDDDRAPLLEPLLAGVSADGWMHHEFFPKTKPEATVSVASPAVSPAVPTTQPAAKPLAATPVALKPEPVPVKEPGPVVAKAEPAVRIPASAPVRPLARVKPADSISANPDTPHVLMSAHPLTAPERGPPEVHTPVYKQWWLWTIVGAAVAGGVVAIVVVSTAKIGQVQANATW